jgi:hypothetical protein
MSILVRLGFAFLFVTASVWVWQLIADRCRPMQPSERIEKVTPAPMEPKQVPTGSPSGVVDGKNREPAN